MIKLTELATKYDTEITAKTVYDGVEFLAFGKLIKINGDDEKINKVLDETLEQLKKWELLETNNSTTNMND